MTESGRPSFARASSVSASMYVSMPLTSACDRRSSTVPLRHSSSFFSASPPPPALCGLQLLAEVDQPLGGVGAAVEQHVLDQLAQLGLDLLVDLEHAGVDDAHVHAGLDGVVQERRVHRLADAGCCRGS